MPPEIWSLKGGFGPCVKWWPEIECEVYDTVWAENAGDGGKPMNTP